MRKLSFFRATDRNLATTALIMLVLLVFAQVIMRVVFLAPLVGAEEFVRYLLIWVVFLGMPYTTRFGDQIKMEELQLFMPKWIRYPIRLLALTSGCIIFCIVSISAIYTTLSNLKNTTATLSIPFWIFFTPTILGFVLVTIETGVRWAKFWKDPDYHALDELHDDTFEEGESKLWE
ncbi:TRAP transporter small permease [Marispirochaeta aestuarii]|uniref:TRAP transporter small permease n=1 Tax=Marispirochaeta aestuarii TaxID=1963862 RepID=UPI0029C7330B|nr:TRAP transporter small permease [Marispirochaeta aestuarii]